jgi:hypothetical protein
MEEEMDVGGMDDLSLYETKEIYLKGNHFISSATKAFKREIGQLGFALLAIT